MSSKSQVPRVPKKETQEQPQAERGSEHGGHPIQRDVTNPPNSYWSPD